MALPKKEILQSLRIALLIAAISVFAGLLYSSIVSYKRVYIQPATVKKPVAVVQYNHQGQIDYWVKLKPNDLFKENNLGPGKTYYSKLTDYINLDYSYLFSADQETQLDGTYIITATLEAKDMWRKDFVLVPRNSFSGKGKKFDFLKNYQLRLAPFKEYLKKINEQIGVAARDPKVIIKVEMDVKASTKAGSFHESLVPSMIMQLTEGEYKIEGSLVKKKGDSITKSVTIADPALEQKKSSLTIVCAATVFAGILLGYLIFYTRGKPGPPVNEDVLIQKKYKTRLLKVPGGIQPVDNVMVVSFDSVDDLVKAADELGKPILYFNSETAGFVNYFVIDGQVVYKYVVSGGKTPGNIRKAWIFQQVERLSRGY